MCVHSYIHTKNICIHTTIYQISPCRMCWKKDSVEILQKLQNLLQTTIRDLAEILHLIRLHLGTLGSLMLLS